MNFGAYLWEETDRKARKKGLSVRHIERPWPPGLRSGRRAFLYPKEKGRRDDGLFR
jgi:hypothetical protein